MKYLKPFKSWHGKREERYIFRKKKSKKPAWNGGKNSVGLLGMTVG